MSLLQNKTAKETKFVPIPQELNQQRSHSISIEADASEIFSANKPTHFLQKQKKKQNTLQEHIDIYCGKNLCFQMSSLRYQPHQALFHTVFCDRTID